MEEYIIETDIGNDCDDAGALAIMNNLIDKLDARILAIACSCSPVESSYCTKIINNYYKHDIMVGQFLKKGYFDNYTHQVYTQIVANENKCDRTLLDYKECLLKAYNEAKDKVNLIMLGPLHAFKEFLKENLELVNSKTKHIYMMACTFCNPPKIIENNEKVIREWNVLQDVEGARYVLENVNVPITFIPFETGLVYTGKNIRKDNPVRRCYDVSFGFLRYSWDPITMYYGLTHDTKTFKESNKGIVSIDSTGLSTFKECKNGKDTILYPNVSDGKVIEMIDNYLK